MIIRYEVPEELLSLFSGKNAEQVITSALHGQYEISQRLDTIRNLCLDIALAKSAVIPVLAVPPVIKSRPAPVTFSGIIPSGDDAYDDDMDFLSSITK